VRCGERAADGADTDAIGKTASGGLWRLGWDDELMMVIRMSQNLSF